MEGAENQTKPNQIAPYRRHAPNLERRKGGSGAVGDPRLKLWVGGWREDSVG